MPQGRSHTNSVSLEFIGKIFTAKSRTPKCTPAKRGGPGNRDHLYPFGLELLKRVMNGDDVQLAASDKAAAEIPPKLSK